MRPLPIRFRLTLWYCGMFACAALLLSGASWWMLYRSIEATLQQEMQERIDDVHVRLQELGPAVFSADTQERLDDIYREQDAGKWLQIRDEAGRWVYRSPRILRLNASLPLPAMLPRKGLMGELADGPRPIRVLSEAITISHHSWSVETGMSLVKPDALLRRHGIDLLLLTPTMLLLAALAGHTVSRRALAPVAAITKEAHRITDKKLDVHLPVSPADDELSRLSQTLNQMLARIDRSFRATREFTANASHELRTPLARLRAETEIALLAQRDSEAYRQALERIQNDAVSMSELMESLLMLARSDAGTQPFFLSPVDIQELVNHAFLEWAPIADRLSIRLCSCGIRVPEFERCMALGDRVSLERLLRIWLDNAFKFTAAGGKVTINITAHDKVLSLAVEDSGIGIASEHHERIFDRFYRVHGDTAQSQQGSGLGLSLAALIAEQHKTRIIVRSAPGQGSRFEISLPQLGPEVGGERILGLGVNVLSLRYPLTSQSDGDRANP